MAGCDVRLQEYILFFRFRFRDFCSSRFGFYGFGLGFYLLYLGTVQTGTKILLAPLLPSSVFLYSRIFEDVNDSSMEILLSCLYIQNSTSSDGIHFANIWTLFSNFSSIRNTGIFRHGKGFFTLEKKFRDKHSLDVYASCIFEGFSTYNNSFNKENYLMFFQQTNKQA